MHGARNHSCLSVAALKTWLENPTANPDDPPYARHCDSESLSSENEHTQMFMSWGDLDTAARIFLRASSRSRGRNGFASCVSPNNLLISSPTKSTACTNSRRSFKY